MTKDNEQILSSHLTAKELLSTRGICSRLIDEYNQVSKVLPKTGVKLFEPNGSWLQNKQIDTCLGTRKDLINVERVNRLSTLAIAEWLPQEKKAKVTKKSGIEWNNYGTDVRGCLYLIPEEALLLLELNCIELLHNGLPLSIQQAYELLLSSSNGDCTLSEYKVFSQLARLGYRLQRFQYEKSKNERLEEMMQPKKKVIIDPENGRWMGNMFDTSSSMIGSTRDESGSDEIQKELEEIMDDIVEKIENDELKHVENVDDKKYDETKTKTKPRVEIVSEELVLDPVKLVVIPTNDLSGASDNKMIKWSGARIQRNVKLLPKRMDIKVPSTSSTKYSKIAAKSQPSTNSSNDMTTVEKRKIEMSSLQSCKKSKQEIIDLSDDDIEEIPRTMTRMEMLNCIPNIASKDCVTQTVLRGYIPHSIKPQKSIYEYDRARILRFRENNRKTPVPLQTCTSEHNTSNDHPLIKNSIIPHYNSSSPSMSLLSQEYLMQYNYQRDRGSSHSPRNSHHISRPSHTGRRYYRGLTSSGYMQNYLMNTDRVNYISNSWSSFQINVFRNIAMVGIALRTSMMQNNVSINRMMCTTGQYHRRHDFRRQNFHRNSSPHRSHRGSSFTKPITSGQSTTELTRLNRDVQYQTSFVRMPADSWSELKRKWKESKTITIEDEDDKMDCSEVEVVQRNVQSLVNAKNARSFSEIYDRLKIIKSAQSKTVRRKKGEYKISYKVYSNTQRYRKSDPGTPMFHLAITRRLKNFMQPVDLQRLQQDGDCLTIIFAYVSDTSISFMQAGFVSLPNLTDK